MRRRPKLASQLAALAAVVAAVLAAAAPAQASERRLLSEFQDDRVFTREGPERLRTALDELDLLGVDVVRTVVNWNRLAPAALERRVPEGFDLASPTAYAPQDWDPFDDLVREATARGIAIHMNPAGHALRLVLVDGAHERAAGRRERHGQHARPVVAVEEAEPRHRRALE